MFEKSLLTNFVFGSFLDINRLRVNALRKAAAYKLFFSMLRYMCKSPLYMKL